MLQDKNFQIKGAEGRKILLDVYFKSDHHPKPIVIFAHGYKGYKDWGAWDLVAEKFVEAGFFFIKFNFSHNGGTLEEPIDFPDLEAFANDNYSKQLFYINCVIDWILTTKRFISEADVNDLSLIGHSRGGGIVALEAARDDKVKQFVTWAGVSDFESRFPKGEKLEKWRKEGVYHVENGRTKQQMPHNYQFFEDFKANENKLNIKRAVQKTRKPYLIVHAKNDPSVDVEEAEKLHKWAKRSELFLLEDSNHVFGTKHPWEKADLSEDLASVSQKTIEFLKSNQR